MAILTSALIMLILWPFTALYTGFVIQTLWFWYIGPVFNVAPLSIHNAVGVAMVVNLFLIGVKRVESDESSPAVKMWFYWIHQLVGITFALFFGWAWHALGFWK